MAQTQSTPVIRHLNVEGLTQTSKDISSNITIFDDAVALMEKSTADLLDTWKGEGRSSYELEYQVLLRQLKDISAALYDIYDALVDAQAAYIEADQTVAKEISTSVTITG